MRALILRVGIKVVLVLCPFCVGANSRDIYLEALLDFERYAETIWVNCTGSNQPPDSGYWGDGGSSGNGGIRGNCGIAVAYAVLVVAQPDNPTNTLRLTRIRKALNYAAGTHTSGSYFCVDGKKWGWEINDWQTPEWAGSMGLACLLVERELPEDTVAAVKRVVASEATHRAQIPPASGYVSDTKLEENAWQGNILALAAAWLKNSTNASLWLEAAKRYLVNTYTVPFPTGNPLDAWVTTQTLYTDWGCENHGIYHPTYLMVGGMSSGDSLLMAKLADPEIGAELEPFAEYNIMNVWSNNLRYMIMESGELAYPSSSTWTLHDYEHNSYLAWIASHFGDPLARYADARLAALVRQQQLVWGDGRFCGPRVPDGFYREAVEARRTAIAWLHWTFAKHPSGNSIPPDEAVVHFPSVKVLAHRSESGFVSVYYASTRPMGWIEPASFGFPTNVFLTTPYLGGIFGHGPLGKATGISLVNVITNPSGFYAELLVQNGTNGQTKVYIKTSGESVGIVEIPLPASGVTATSAGCFTNGIQNDPLTGGKRRVEWDGGTTNIIAKSGTVVNITSRWVCVDDRYGFVAGPSGYFRYRGVTGYDSTLHVMQDTLCFQPAPQQYRLAPRYAVWFLNKSAAQTASLASRTRCYTNGSSFVLEFPGRGTNTVQIVASLLSGNGTWAVDTDGLWSDPTMWVSGLIADGAGFFADFSKLNITTDRTVYLDSPRVLSGLIFGDLEGTQNWVLKATNEGSLRLAGSSPYVLVTNNTAIINVPILGENGFTKLGPGRLVLSSPNLISGTLYLDAGTSFGMGDGTVCFAHPAAGGNLSEIIARNNTGSSNGSTLQLDGTGGGIVVTQKITFSCRNNWIPNLQNLAGSNVIAGPIYMQVGGSNVVISCDKGTLVIASPLRYIGSYTSGRGWSFWGSGTISVKGPILAADNGASISVAMFGSGVLELCGTNTYTGPTVVYNGTLRVRGVIKGAGVTVYGTLQGPGVINAPVIIASNGICEIGDEIGSLVINAPFTNMGKICLKVQRVGSLVTNDSLTGIVRAVLNGQLQVKSIGEPLQFGDTFRLLSASQIVGRFDTVQLPEIGPGLVWDTGSLYEDGSISVGLGQVTPIISKFEVRNGKVVVEVTVGAAGAPLTILSHTNLLVPTSQWEPVWAGRCDASGRFAWTNEVSEGSVQRYYTVRVP